MARGDVMKDGGLSVRHLEAIAGTRAATVSAAGSAQNDATELTADLSLITTASAGEGVRLMSFAVGSILVANGTAVSVLVYPISGGKINNGTTNAAITLYPGLGVEFHAISSTEVLAVYVAIPDGSVTNAKLADMAAATIKGRAAGAGTGDPTDLTAAQVRDAIGLDTDDNVGFAQVVAGRATALAPFATPALESHHVGIGRIYGGFRWSNSAFGAFIDIAKSRGTSIGDYTVVQSGDVIADITFWGADGTDLAPAASILAIVDGTPGSDDMPGRLQFQTTPDGSAASVEALRLDSSQRPVFNATTTTPATLGTNGQWSLTPTSNTNFRISYRGSDGTTRTADITLA